MRSNSWFIRQPGASRRFRLYCFCYAGGSAASFMPWQALLNPGIEVCAVQLPGRGTRMHEQHYTDFPALIKALAQVMSKEREMPFAFFGHSLGALIAFELTRYCKYRHLPEPKRIFMSGCDAPQHKGVSKNLHSLPDDGLIEALEAYNGTPSEILANRELLELVLPTIRADFALAANYQYRPMPPLDIPITVFEGRLDEHIRLDDVGGWARETTADCRVHWFEGDHFFINGEQQKVIDLLNSELTELLPEPFAATAGGT